MIYYTRRNVVAMEKGFGCSSKLVQFQSSGDGEGETVPAKCVCVL